MMMLSPTQWALCVLAVAFSAILRGYSGFGFALAATPLLVSLIPPTAAVPVVLMLQIGSSLVGLKRTIADSDRRSVAPTAILALRNCAYCNAKWTSLLHAPTAGMTSTSNTASTKSKHSPKTTAPATQSAPPSAKKS